MSDYKECNAYALKILFMLGYLKALIIGLSTFVHLRSQTTVCAGTRLERALCQALSVDRENLLNRWLRKN